MPADPESSPRADLPPAAETRTRTNAPAAPDGQAWATALARTIGIGGALALAGFIVCYSSKSFLGVATDPVTTSNLPFVAGQFLVDTVIVGLQAMGTLRGLIGLAGACVLLTLWVRSGRSGSGRSRRLGMAALCGALIAELVLVVIPSFRLTDVLRYCASYQPERFQQDWTHRLAGWYWSLMHQAHLHHPDFAARLDLDHLYLLLVVTAVLGWIVLTHSATWAQRGGPALLRAGLAALTVIQSLSLPFVYSRFERSYKFSQAAVVSKDSHTIKKGLLLYTDETGIVLLDLQYSELRPIARDSINSFEIYNSEFDALAEWVEPAAGTQGCTGGG